MSSTKTLSAPGAVATAIVFVRCCVECRSSIEAIALSKIMQKGTLCEILLSVRSFCWIDCANSLIECLMMSMVSLTKDRVSPFPRSRDDL